MNGAKGSQRESPHVLILGAKRGVKRLSQIENEVNCGKHHPGGDREMGRGREKERRERKRKKKKRKEEKKK